MKGPMLFLIVVALCVRHLSATFRGAFPSGYEPYQPLMEFDKPENTGLYWMYTLCTPLRPKKLKCTDMLLRTRSLTLIILIIGCVENHPCEFMNFIFDYYSRAILD